MRKLVAINTLERNVAKRFTFLGLVEESDLEKRTELDSIKLWDFIIGSTPDPVSRNYYDDIFDWYYDKTLRNKGQPTYAPTRGVEFKILADEQDRFKEFEKN